MGKSYRRPYSSAVGHPSAKKDKQIANRALRRTQNNYTKQFYEDDGFLIPHKYECSHNEVYGWSRDGKVKYQTLEHSWNNYCLYYIGYFNMRYKYDCFKYYGTFPPEWYERLKRK